MPPTQRRLLFDRVANATYALFRDCNFRNGINSLEIVCANLAPFYRIHLDEPKCVGDQPRTKAELDWWKKSIP